MGAAASHRFEEHTAEVLLRVEAPSLAALYAEAGRALAELLTDDPSRVSRTEPESLVVEAADRAALLVAFLDEIVFRAETRGRVYPEVVVERVTDRTLTATIRGGAPATWRTAVKAATWHRLLVAEAPDGDGFVATVVLDV
jgi:SHS2 domain-containing protein